MTRKLYLVPSEVPGEGDLAAGCGVWGAVLAWLAVSWAGFMWIVWAIVRRL